MATLNDVPFKIIRQVFTTVQNNSIKDILGSDTVSVEHMGYSTEPLRLVCFVQNEDEYDNFKEEYHSSGTQTLIIHESSGRQYTVYGLSSTTEIDGEIENYKQGIVFMATFKQATPYKESTEEITRTKSITTQNQEWTADDDGNDVKTLGNVDAVPDIQVTGKIGNETIDQSMTAIDSGHSASASYGQTFTTGSGIKLITRIDFKCGPEFPEKSGTLDLKIYDDPAKTTLLFTQTGVSYACLTGGNWNECILDDNVALAESTQYYFELDNFSSGFNSGKSDTSKYAGGNWYFGGASSGSKDMGFKTYYKILTDTPEIYNVIDTTVKCVVANIILDTAIHKINADATGTIDYDDDFSTIKWSYNSTNLGITHDTINNELDIADDGYIYWKEDTKYPITGTPTLTARINITAGTPTIQISTDASTWYDIDTAIVDDVETVYPLDSDGNISLAGKTVFYWRIDCVKAAAATCSIKSFELDIAIHTIYAKNPKITKGASASTFRCDQDPDSGLACIVELIFRHRWWT